MSQSISDPTQLPLARAFAAELRRLHERMAYADYKSSQLIMRVHYSEIKTTCEVELTTGDYPSTVVKGSSLGPVMDEAYRRLNYQDREQARIDSSMTALPAPAASSEEEGA